jgi:ribonuclease BN (tRNA processing enzyme)
MKITFLGSGSAFVLAKENYQSNIMIETEDHTLLFDAGTTIPEALNDLGYTVNSFDSIFVSHNHADHVGGLEYIGFKKYFSTFPFGEDRPQIIAHNSVMDELWDNSLRGGMRTLQGKSASLDTYFNPVYLQDSGSFMLDSYIKYEIIQTIHVIDDRRFMPSYGLMLTNVRDTELGKIFITGDTQLAPNQMMSFYEQAHVIFHDCELAEYPNSVHAQYHELKKLPDTIKAKMWLYHYILNDDYPELPDAVADGFLGFVKRGDSFDYQI